MSVGEGNRLSGEKSPYLLQHAANPVHWQPWGAEAFEIARREDKPVFLSVGYSTCHWCHVMARESFEDPQIAGLMNRLFVNVKVDREERPDVDRVHMAFVQATTGSGGWPMSVWLTPEGKPFYCGTYFPPSSRYGRIGFPDLLLRISELWNTSRDQVLSKSEEVQEALRESSASTATNDGAGLNPEPLARGLRQFSKSFDAENGGFGGAPKFPRPSVLNFLFRMSLREGGGRAAEVTLFTLRKMAAGGMHDHLGGGFHRYSVDEFWHVPHFEKMLYDQAQLAISYVEGWQITHDETFAKIARGMLDYVLRDMTHPLGGFYSAEDADSSFTHGSHEHGEGVFYIWTREEIVEALGSSAAGVFCLYYGVEAEGNAPPGSDPHGEFNGRNILLIRTDLAAVAEVANMTEAEVAVSLERSRAILFDLREQRPRPHRDDKILTAWNGLMISAFSKAVAAFSEPRYLDAARSAARFLREHLRRPDGDLLRSWRDGPSDIAAFAEDHAFLIQGLLDLYEASFEIEWLQWAVDLQARQDELFWDSEGGGYFSSRAGDPLVPVRMKEDYDGAEPSAGSVSALNLLRLARTLHDESLEARATRILSAAREVMSSAPTAVPQMLVALDLALSPPAQAIIAGVPGAEDTRQWISVIRKDFHPHWVSALADGGEFLARNNPALAEMKPVNGRAALYLCKDFTCQAPEADPDNWNCQTANGGGNIVK